MSRRSSGVSSTETAPMFSSKRCSFVVPGIGTIHGFLGKQPSERDLGGCRLLPFCDAAEQVNQGLIRLESLRREARQGAVEVGAVEVRVFIDLAREEAQALIVSSGKGTLLIPRLPGPLRSQHAGTNVSLLEP